MAPKSYRRTVTKNRKQQHKILSALIMAAGFFTYPFGITEAATEIVPKSGPAPVANNHVYDIDPQHTSDQLAYNLFEKFNLAQGDIANLRFGSADVLANLVKNRINIDGVVNGIKNNKIDGHLIFLSPDGIAVGSTGVINAGSFTGIVPSSKAFENLYNTENNTENNITLDAINGLKTGSFAPVTTDGDSNVKGNIDIKGTINTHSGVMLGAGIININDGARLQSTKSLDFTDLVNIKNGDTITASAGLGNSIEAVVGTGGDIILMAKQESAVKDTKIEKDTNGQDKEVANAIRWKDRSTDLDAKVSIRKGVSVISTDGAVKLTAESTSTYEDSTPMTLTDTLKGIILGDDNKLINGLVDKLAKKEAGANKYLFVNYSSKKNKASVKIGENTTITGKNIDIAATSKVELKQSIAVSLGQGKKDSEGKTVDDSSKAIAAVAVSRVYNNADVVIDGNLTANGADGDGNGIKVSANADTTAALSATGTGGEANAVAVGVAVLTGDTKSKVTVNNPTAMALTAAQGKVTMNAVTGSDIDVNVGAVGKKSYVVSNVGLANYDTSADVSINRSITAGAVEVKAENNITGLKITVNNAVKDEESKGKDTAQASDGEKEEDNNAAAAEESKPDSEKSEDEKKSEQKSKDPTQVVKDASADANDEKTQDAAGSDGKGGVKDVKDKVEGTNEGGGNEKKTSAFGLGASVGILSNKNDANVTIGKNAVITATKPEQGDTPDGAVNFSAKTLMTASAEKEDSLKLTVKNAQANSAKVEIGAAVLVSNVKNNANIVLDSDGDKSAQIKGSAVSLDAAAGMGKYQKDNKDTDSVLSYEVSSEGQADKETPATVVLDGSVGINTLKNNAIVLLGQQTKIDGSAVSLSADADTNAKGTYGATEANNKVGVGATVGLQNISGNSLIMAGKGVTLNGTDSVSAAASTALDGTNEVKNAGKGESIGVSGMVALSYGDSNSIVSLDDEISTTAPAVMLTATNSTNVDNSARSESTGVTGSKAFGIGVGIVNYDVNSLAMISDNGSGISAPSGSTTDAEKAAQKVYQDAALARTVAGDTFAGKLGTATTGDAKGSITTGSYTAAAITTGMLKNDAKAKASTSGSEDTSGNENKDSEKWTKWSKKGDEGAKEAKNNTDALENDTVTAQNESAAPTVTENTGEGQDPKVTNQKNNATGAGKEAASAANPEPDNDKKDEGAAPAAGSSESAGASIGMEGSVALTFLGGRTDAVLNNVTVQNGDDAVGSVALSATDFLGSITLGGTDIKHSLKEGSSSTKVAIGGTFAMNSSNRDVDSILRNSNLQKVESVSNTTSKTGIEVAAGMGVSVSKGDGTNVAGAGVVYYNKANQDIHALLVNNTVNSSENGGQIDNKATSTDFQIAGALAANLASGSNTNVGFGGAVAISNLENNLSSGIIGGSYQNKFQAVNVEAQKGTTQISGAVAGGKSGYGFNGAFAYGSVKNTTSAYISGATVQGDTNSAVNVKAGEIPVLKADDERNSEKQQIEANNKLDNQTKSVLKDAVDADKNNKKTLEDAGVDTTGKVYLENGDEQSALDDAAKTTDEGKIADDAAKDESDAKDELGKNHSLTITAAMAGGLESDAGFGAGIAYNYVKNDIGANITNSTITAETVNGEAATDATIVSVGAGVAIGGKTFNGAGSGSWNDLKNDTKVTFANNTITGKNISEQAQNTSSIINIAGEVAGGKGMAVGLSLAYNSLNNTTGTYLKDNIIHLNGGENSVKLASTNQSKALAVAGAVNVNIKQSILGATGTVAINRGVNNTESVLAGKTTGEKTKLEDVKELSVTAEELSKKTTVAGAVSVGGKKVGFGGAVAYTSVGTDEKKESLLAEINHVDITTTNNGKVEVSVKDSKQNNNELEKSRVITVGSGLGVQWGKNWFTLQGAAAVSDIYKTSRAALNNSNINQGVSDNPTIDVTADTRSKINTVGAVANIDISTAVKGTAGVAINRTKQNTTAEMASDNTDTTVNAGLTQVRATGDADIHSVGVGGTVGVGGYVAFAGSGSYNYINNDVNAIIKKQNLTSNSSVGVVAQSDDRLYNFAGGFAIGANTKVGLGASVSINKIEGSTNALVQGGSLKAADTGSIKVTRPQDNKLFDTESIDLKTDSNTKLSGSRTEEGKTGIVVDSSATHTIISQQSSGGVAISSNVGVDLAGTVNINTVTGDTTAKIKDAVINTANSYSDVNVNAVDYTNFGSFTGTATIGGGALLGASVGVSANWETFDRKTEAELSSASDKKNIYAKNLTVDATAKHGSNALAFGVAASGGKVGIASGDSIMRHKNTSTTSALLSNVNTIFDGKADIKAEHFGSSYTQNISASAAAGMVSVTAGAGVSVMDDTSTVKAEVDRSDLKAKSSTEGKNISVQALNENKWRNLLVAAGASIGLGAGLTANVGINNTTGATSALVANSNLAAYDVLVNATDKLTAKSTGGMGSGGLVGVGVAVTLNNISSSVSTQVTGGSIKAAHDIDVKADEDRSFDSQVTGVTVGGVAAGVNVAVTSINKSITDAQLSNAQDEKGQSMNVNSTTQSKIQNALYGEDVKDEHGNDVHVLGVNDIKGALGINGAKFYGLKGDERNNLADARNTTVSLSVPVEKIDKQGIHTLINGNASLTAAENLNVTATEKSDISVKGVNVTAGGGASVNVTDAIIHTNYDTDVTMNNATLDGKNVNVKALQTQNNDGSKVGVTAVTVGALGGVGVGYAGIVNKGATDINVANSTIKGAENVTISATDESKHKSEITNVGVSALNVTTTFASVENKNNVGVTLAGANNISAAQAINIDAKRANALEAHTQGVGVGGVAVAVNHATIEDGGKENNLSTGNAVAKIKDTSSKFTAGILHLGATNDTTAKLSAGNTTVSLLGVSRMRGKGVMNMGAEVDVAGGTFDAAVVDFSAQLGNAGGRTLEGNVKGHNVSGIAVAPDAVVLNTDVTSKVNVRNSSFNENATLLLGNESYVDRKAYIYGVTAGAVAVGNTSADISGKETLETSLTGKTGTTKLDNLFVLTNGQNIGKAFADAGGGGLVGYVGAHVDNKSINKVSSTLGGKWDVAGEVWLVANQKDETRLTASEGHGGIAGVGGTSVDNTIDTTTKANVADNTEITSDRIHVGTDNTVITGAYDDTDSKDNKDVQTYTLKDHFGGVISGNRLRSLLNITETSAINVGKNAKITTGNLQEYTASSQNDLTNLVQAKGGGAVVVTDAVSELNINVNNKVNVDSGAVLSNEKSASTEDIILSAYDGQTIKSHVDGTVYAGVVSPIVAKNNIDMNRRTDVTVAGTIESGSNVGLYAGANKSGVLANMKADLKSGAYNYSVIPITIPRVNYTITADRGTVNVSGDVHSTRDINAIASGGKEEIVKDESLWSWAKGGASTDKKFLTSSAATGTETDVEMLKSTVNVTGSLIAGTAAPINVTIDGTVAGGLRYTADNNVTNQRVLQGITKGTFDYANTLGARLTELNKLIAAYDGNAEKMAAYIAERDRIQTEMKSLGLVEIDGQGNVTSYINSGRPVYYVEIPDIATSGGNINVTASDFIGTGKLRANSAPSITIENKSDAYLKLNNILMGEQGGSIIYNGYGPHLQGTVIPTNVVAGNQKINEMNRNEDGTKLANFREIYGVSTGTAAGLSVLNTKTFSGDKTSTFTLTPELEQEINNSNMSAAEKEEYRQEINKGNLKYTAITDIEVNGKISNFYGNVTINNASGDIRISGGTNDRPTGVFGNTVKLIAANGSIAQDYKEGIVNINGDPEKYLSSKANDMKTALHLNTTANDTENKTETYQRTDNSNEATGYIAGRDIYVSAANVNVNGLIQSGYKNYVATVTETQLAEAKQSPAKRAAVIQNRTMFRVNDGGAKWNATDEVFDYVPQVYWDPSTDKLVVEDIDTAGGKIYLTGKIASTGDGRIMAADGAADISVTNETTLDMNVGKVLNNQREGIITIADTSNDTWTEYKRGQTRTITDYATYLKNHASDSDIYASAAKSTNSLSVGNPLTYNVKKNQTYSWVNGNSVETTQTYQHYERRGFWGLVQTADEQTLKGWESSSTPIDTNEAKKLGLPEGAVITDGSNINLENDEIRLDGNTTLLESRTFDRDHWVTRSGFLGWFKHIYDRWKVGTSTIMLYNYTINASKPIKVGLIGAEKGSINLNSTNAAGGSINLTGNVANSHNQAELNISSVAGGISQFDNTTLKSEIVTLKAKNDIKNIHLASVGTAEKDGNGNVTKVDDNIKLTAISTGKGNIDITAVGGILENRSLPGNVEIVALKSQDGSKAFDNTASLGNVSLNAAGNITQSGSSTTIEGRGIYLTSNDGGIGTANQAVQIASSDLVYATDRSGAQVNADARNSIYLTEAAEGSDMRVGKIESRGGDVTLTVKNGGFIDALPGDDKSASNDSVDEMVHRWIDAGLIDGEKDGNGNYIYKGAYIEGLEKSRDDYQANVTAAYDVNNGGKTKAQWLEEYNKQKPAVEEIYASAEYGSYLANKAKYDALSPEECRELADSGNAAFMAYAKSAEKYAQYSKYGSAADYLKDSAAYKYSKHDNAAAYLANDATYKELKSKADNPTFEWTKDMMLYAVSEALVNPASGNSTQTARAANVLGNNITLNSAKAVGNVSESSTTITVEDLTGNNRIESMKKLMSMEASDVKAERDANGNLLSFKITPNMPLGIKSTGTLNVQAGGDVSVAGRADEAGEHSAINVGTVAATQNSGNGDVRLYSEKGIYNALTDDTLTNITGKNLIIAGGEESIGTSEKPLTVSLTGDLTQARANKNVFINNTKDNDFLRLGAMYAGDTISLNSEKGFKMSNANTSIADSYINAGKTLKLKTNATTGIVGEVNNAIRILNDRVPVNIVANSAYIHGVGSLNLGIQDGTMVLGNIATVGQFTAVSDGSLTLGREEEKNSVETVTKETVAGAIEAGGDVTLTAAHNLVLDGTVKAGDLTGNNNKVLTLTAADGIITQTSKGAITANEVKTFNSNSLLLDNIANAFNSITVDGIPTTAAEKPAIDGLVRIMDNADALTVAVNRKVAGDISVNNLRNGGSLVNAGNLTAAGSISLGAKGTLSQAANTSFSAGKDVTLTSAKANISQAADAGIQSAKVTAVSARTVDLHGTGNRFESVLVKGAQSNTPILGDALIKSNANTLQLSLEPTVNGNIDVENRQTKGVIRVLSNLKADGGQDENKGNITLKSDGSMQTDRQLTATRDINLTSTSGAMTIGGAALANHDITLNSKGNMETVGSLTAGNDMKLTSTAGAMTIKGAARANRDMTMQAQNALNTTGKLTAGNDMKLISTAGAMTIGGDATANRDMMMQSKNALNTTGNLEAGRDMKLTSTAGTMTIGGDASADHNLSLTSKGNMKTTGNLTAGYNAALTSTNGSMIINGDVTAVNSEIALKSNGDMQTTGKVTAGTDAKLNSTAGAMTIGGAVTANRDIVMESKKALNTIGKLTAGTDMELTSTAGTMTIKGDAAANHDMTLRSMGNMETSGQLKATNDMQLISSFGAMTVNGAASTDHDMLLNSKGDMQTTGKLTAGNDAKLYADGGAMTIKGDATANHDMILIAKGDMETRSQLKAINDMQLISTGGAITVSGEASADHDMLLNSDGDMQTTGKLTAGNDAFINANYGAMTIGGATSAGHDMTMNSKGDMNTTGKLTAGNDMKLTSDDGAMTIAGDASANRDITLKSMGNMQTKGKLTAKNNLDITSTHENVVIGGNISTGTKTANFLDLHTDMPEEGTYNFLRIHARGAVQEQKGVEIATPVVETYSGKDVSLANEENKFGVYIGNAADGSSEIDGNVKVVTTRSGAFTALMKDDVRGDVFLTNRAQDGDLGFLVDNNEGMKILGGENALGSFVLSANNDVLLLGDVSAKQDITLVSEGKGSIYGIGRGLEAGNDIHMLARDAVYYMGTVDAGNNVHFEANVSNAENTDKGIFIGSLPETITGSNKDTSIKAGNMAIFNVNGNGDIFMTGNIASERGSVNVNISDKGNISIGDDVESHHNTITANKDINVATKEGTIVVSKSISSTNENVSVETGKGDIYIGLANVHNDETVKANKNVSVGTDLGTVYILGKTVTQNGDISMKAGKDVYTEGKEGGNFIIQEDGMLDSGGNINLNGRNGDIYISDKLSAKKGISADIAEQGSVIFEDDVDVNKDVNIATEKGDILVGHTINAQAGNVNLTTGTGDILVGKDITAKEQVAISSNQGNIIVGDESLGDAGNVLTKTGDVSIRTNKGKVDILKTVTAQEGSIRIGSGQGDILIGNNGPDVETVTARESIELTAEDGRVVVYGKTSTKNKDITISANGKNYVPGEGNSTFIIDQNGKLESGGAINLNLGNGDLHISDRIQSKKDLTADLQEQGGIYFDTDVDVEGTVKLKTANGDINVGHDVQATSDIILTTGNGHIDIGASVNSTAGNLQLATDQGDIDIGHTVQATKDISVTTTKGNIDVGASVNSTTGNVQLTTEQGNIDIGDTVQATKDISVTTTKGNIDVGASVNSAQGGLKLATDQGNIDIGHTVQATKDVSVTTNKGNIDVGASVNAVDGGLKLATEEGYIDIGDTVQATRDVSVTTTKGNIDVGASVNSAAGNLQLVTDQGNIGIGDTVQAHKNLSMTTNEGNIDIGAAVTTKTGDMQLAVKQGDINIGKELRAQQGNIGAQVNTGNVTIGDNGPDVETVTAQESINMSVNRGTIGIYGKTSTKNGDISMAAGGDKYASGVRNIIIEQNGELESGRDVELIGRNGDLHVTDAVQAQRNMNIQVKEAGDVSFDSTVDVTGDVTALTEDGSIAVAKDLTGNLVDFQVGKGDIEAKNITANSAVNMRVQSGNILTENISAHKGVNMTVYSGDIATNNITANEEVNMAVQSGNIATNNITANRDVNMTVQSGNIVTEDVSANSDVKMTVQNGDISIHDVTAGHDTTISNTGEGSINGNNITSEEVTHVALTNGDLFLNLAEGKAVFLQMENNTEASRVNQVRAQASGDVTPDVALTGNFIQIGTMTAKGGSSIFELSAMGAGDEKLINGSFSIDSLRSGTGTHMANLWSNRGFVHVDEGQLLTDDVLAIDKIHFDNQLTDMAIYGRTPTHDGEQLVYWNNLSMANSKAQSYQLFTDGWVRTSKAVLVDAGMNLNKLYGDNLSVVDGMMERETNLHGTFTFDWHMLTEPGAKLQEQVVFAPGVLDFAARSSDQTDNDTVEN